MNAAINPEFAMLHEYDGNGSGIMTLSSDMMEFDDVDDEPETGTLTAATLVRTLPSDVTLIERILAARR